MKKNRKIILIGIFCLLLLVFIFVQILSHRIVKQANDIAINDIDLSSVENGEYIGEYAITPVYAKVKISVKNQEIVDIQILEHNNGLGTSAEKIVDKVLENQSLDIDAVSGATVSSRCILKAIDNAIEKE
ncbi:Predicted NADH:ubiquinone oxidoreductase%2C subunit RnfG [uncultured Roseburia sp.]|uniref:FMN-binding protein n=1 Tax=Brotonthovivens ammoniilytica TaxID=2981725 RepID=A0ABT2THT0_9FIRM|nr:FMN-binding protein [Brotonthovivens ammoniilytica]MCU6761755.1 FMN-binding protein [Brotonthovivens ammoniilytica]SCI45592.1 Predicted NADH:ubiquinone oxidoreductase%2C subunit RnfG [uncultured Roseburia sp.]